MTFEQNWATYRDGFGATTGNDNYWLGLDKVYSLMQLGSTRLKVEASLRKQQILAYLLVTNTNNTAKPTTEQYACLSKNVNTV